MTNKFLAVKPGIFIPEGEELRVPPLTPFVIGCNITKGDPTPTVAWHNRSGKNLFAIGSSTSGVAQSTTHRKYVS